MINYIRADLYRIFKDKKFIATLALYVALFMGFVYMGQKNFQVAMDVVNFVNILVRLSFLYVGILIFYLVYGMELKAKTSHQVLARGMGRWKLILSKLIVLVIMIGFMFIGLFLTVYMASIFLGVALDGEAMKVLAYNILAEGVKSLVYFSLTSIFVFKSENPVMGMSAYVLLASGIIGSLMGIILNSSLVVRAIGDQSRFLVAALSNNFLQVLMTGKGAMEVLPALGLYLVLANLLAIVLYRKSELEF